MGIIPNYFKCHLQETNLPKNCSPCACCVVLKCLCVLAGDLKTFGEITLYGGFAHEMSSHSYGVK